MTRRDLMRHLKSHDCVLAREGRSHTIIENPANGHRAPLAGVSGLDQRLQKVIQVAVNPIPEHKTLTAGKPARVLTRPENQVVGLGDHQEVFTLLLHHDVVLGSSQAKNSRAAFGGKR
jgi:hypothetical protein